MVLNKYLVVIVYMVVIGKARNEVKNCVTVGSAFDDVTSIDVVIDVTIWDDSGSDTGNKPDVSVEVWNGSIWVCVSCKVCDLIYS